MVMATGGREETGLEALAWLATLEHRGAGEILLTSMDRDGTRSGYDLDLTEAAARAVGIPVIASGGAGSLAHLADAFEAGAQGVLAASIFHFDGTTIADARAFLRGRGIPVRPVVA
jgi:cyclase